jgi:hypothetical protein
MSLIRFRLSRRKDRAVPPLAAPTLALLAAGRRAGGELPEIEIGVVAARAGSRSESSDRATRAAAELAAFDVDVDVDASLALARVVLP